MSGSSAADVASQFQFVAAPDDLSPYVNSLYCWRNDAVIVRDALPAYSGQLITFVEGHAEFQPKGGELQTGGDGFFIAPLLQAQAFAVHGPGRAYGVSLNFRGWAALTNLPVTGWHDCMFDLEHGLSADLAERFRALAPAVRSGALDDAGVYAAMAQIVRDGLREMPEQHAQVIDVTHRWLNSGFNPSLDDLYAALPYSERQVQRLVARFFGQSPIRLIRRYRAVRAATLLSFPALPDEIEAEIREAFYDQAHMIKELRYFTGRTPKRLVPAEGAMVHDTLGPDGYGSVDPYAGIEAQQLGKDIRDL